MLLGHWYLVQPGLARGPLLEIVRWTLWIWPVEVAVLLSPRAWCRCSTARSTTTTTACSASCGWAVPSLTGVLLFVTRAALKERSYSAVMAATGLLYLAILTAFGTDLVARAVLAGH